MKVKNKPIAEEYVKPNTNASNFGNIHILEEEKPCTVIKVIGEISGEMFDLDGNLIDKRYIGKNLILFELRLLMGMWAKFNFNKGDQPVNGLTHLAVGSGGPYIPKGCSEVQKWSLQNPPQPGIDIYNTNEAGSYDPDGDGLSELVNEIARREVFATFVDGDGFATETPTRVVDFKASFGADVVGPLTEMALFGGPGAENPNDGYMASVKTFEVWNKKANCSIVWTYRFHF